MKKMEYNFYSEKINENINFVKITYINHGQKRKIIPVFQQITDGKPDWYMIPCVNYNGNCWGDGAEPKGMTNDGEPWIFPSDRVGLSGCSIVEKDGVCTGIFAGKQSQNASSSIYFDGIATYQRIYFSHIEYPKTYLRKYEYGQSIKEFISIDNEECKTFECYVFKDCVNDKNFGYKKMYDFCNKEILEIPTSRFSEEFVKQSAEKFIFSLTEKTEHGYLSNIGLLPNGEHRLGDENCRFILEKITNMKLDGVDKIFPLLKRILGHI